MLFAETGLVGLDWAVLVGYFLILLVVVWRSSRSQQSSKDYFLAGRNIGWFAIGASLFASNIGSEHIVGLSGNGFTDGVAMAHWELHAWILLMLGWVFVPFYYRTGVYTMPEFLERRYSATARWILSIVSLVAYILTKVSVTVYAGAIVFSALLPDLFGDPDRTFWLGALLTLVVTGVYTVFGGFRAVVYTDAMQAVVLLIGSIAITALGLSRLGGFGELQTICRANADNFSLWRPLDDPNFPWLGILIASPIVGIWYWCTDQYIVQRTLAARDLRAARRGTIWGAYLKLSPVFIFLMPGLIAYALVQKDMITIADPDKTFSIMVQELLPIGLRGLVVAGLIAALMSSLSSMFNSCSALFTIDIYHKLHPEASDRHLVTVGRIATLIVVALGILWIPVMKWVSGGGLYLYLQSVQGYLAPPITAVFLLGLFSKRVTSQAAVAGLVSGFVLGMVKLTLQAIEGANARAIEAARAAGDAVALKAAEAAAMPDWLGAIARFNFLYASGVLFVIAVIVIIVVSLMTKAPDEAKIANLTFSTCTEEQRRENRESWNAWDVLHTVIILGAVVGIYVFFTVWLW